jgi:DNA repair exonuclease SbcCD ATPase subunit
MPDPPQAKVRPAEVEPTPPPAEPIQSDGPQEPPEEENEEKKDVEAAQRRTQSLWELSEPFEKVIKSRRRRLAKINYLLEMTKDKLSALEDTQSPEDEAEREKLRMQVDEIMGEKEEIVNIEDGIAEMERIYRNLLALQEAELEKKQDALKNRLQTFEEKIEEWTQERNGLKSKEKDLKTRESEIMKKLQEIQQRELNIQDREKQLKDKMRDLRREELDIMKMKFTGDSSSLETQKGWVKKGEGAQAEVVPVDSNGGPSPDQVEINRRIDELEEQVKKAVEERESLRSVNETISKNQVEVKRILKILDDLLEKLPEAEIKRFADSEDFKLYEKVLDEFEM